MHAFIYLFIYLCFVYFYFCGVGVYQLTYKCKSTRVWIALMHGSGLFPTVVLVAIAIDIIAAMHDSYFCLHQLSGMAWRLLERQKFDSKLNELIN